jgi:hypothetical protein
MIQRCNDGFFWLCKFGTSSISSERASFLEGEALYYYSHGLSFYFLGVNSLVGASG